MTWHVAHYICLFRTDRVRECSASLLLIRIALHKSRPCLWYLYTAWQPCSYFLKHLYYLQLNAAFSFFFLFWSGQKDLRLKNVSLAFTLCFVYDGKILRMLKVLVLKDWEMSWTVGKALICALWRTMSWTEKAFVELEGWKVSVKSLVKSFSI